MAILTTNQPPERGEVLEALLEAMLGELRAIRVALERPPRPAAGLTREDRARLAKILPAVGGVYGSETFSSRDLVEDAAPAVRLVVRGLSVKRVSKLFARAAGIPIDGLLVQKRGVEDQVTVWQIVGR